jgi:hypothetical protein
MHHGMIPAPPLAPPFATTEDAWFWTMGALLARREGGRRDGPKQPRPCEPDDVVRCLDGLYRHRRIDLRHARVLRMWGERQTSPGRDRGPSDDCRLWREAIDRLGPLLRQKGIVALQEIGKNTLTGRNRRD